ncbi:MAG: membrane protein insertion efficiency factor YidD [Gemmataceae bacterium]
MNWRGLYQWPFWLAGQLVVVLVRGYQYGIRPLIPPSCRYEPGCSEYMILAVRKYGVVWGVPKGLWRICRCHPWCEGGYDPP